MTKVGDTLYELNRHPRQHEPRWTPQVILGETARSWLIATFSENHPARTRIDKKTLLTARDRQGHRAHFYTAEGREAYDFCSRYGRDIASAVSVCGDPEKLRQIAAIVGKELNE